MFIADEAATGFDVRSLLMAINGDADVSLQLSLPRDAIEFGRALGISILKGSTMLVLSRKSRESVVVGCAEGSDGVLTVTVLDISGGRVRLGFEGAPDFAVDRLEVWEKMHVGRSVADSTLGPPTAIG